MARSQQRPVDHRPRCGYQHRREQADPIEPGHSMGRAKRQLSEPFVHDNRRTRPREREHVFEWQGPVIEHPLCDPEVSTQVPVAAGEGRAEREGSEEDGEEDKVAGGGQQPSLPTAGGCRMISTTRLTLGIGPVFAVG